MGKIVEICHKFIYLLWCFSLFLTIIHAQCIVSPGSDFISNGCACNFMGACSIDATTNNYKAFSKTANYLKKYVPNFRSLAQNGLDVVEICEPGQMGIFYDCKNSIPLAATFVLTETQYRERGYARDDLRFRRSRAIHRNFQQQRYDYTNCLEHVTCYESPGNVYVEQNWYRSSNKGDSVAFGTRCSAGSKYRLPAAVHRGHLVAALYGRKDRVYETFVYTNSVPQFMKLNTGQWKNHEYNVLIWARRYCGSHPLHIIVGCVPSTYRIFGRTLEPRFLGPTGFSNSQTETHRVNVPAFLWTAICCGLPTSGVNSAGFYSANVPSSNAEVISLDLLSSKIGVATLNLFPKLRECQDPRSYKI